MGRPAIGAAIVDKLECGEHARERLRLLVSTLTQEMTVAEACEALGVSRARLHKLRDDWLAASTAALVPRRAGRQPRVETPEDREIRRLSEENERLRQELRVARERVAVAALRPAASARGATRGAGARPARGSSGKA